MPLRTTAVYQSHHAGKNFFVRLQSPYNLGKQDHQRTFIEAASLRLSTCRDSYTLSQQIEPQTKRKRRAPQTKAALTDLSRPRPSSLTRPISHLTLPSVRAGLLRSNLLNIVYKASTTGSCTMAFFPVQTNMLSLLHYQHRLYTSELAASHRTLSKVYKKLERTERGLSDWKDRGLKRKDKKKLQWDRATTKTAVRDAEANQALLHDYLRQCSDLIASYSPHFFQGAQLPWAASPLSPTADSFAPGGEVPSTPWTAGPFEERAAWNREGPQYWDLSMLRERQPPSTGTPDSGFHESLNEMAAGVDDTTRAGDTGSSWITASSSHRSSVSEKDELAELALSAPAKLGAEAPEKSHRRRYSENAMATIESRLTRASRVESVPPPSNRTSSETRVRKE